MMRRRRVWREYHDKISLRQQVIERTPGGAAFIRCTITVVINHGHFKATSPTRNRAADAAHSDYAQGRAKHFAAQ